MATVVILHTNDIHGHLTAWEGWEGDLKDKTVGEFGRLAGGDLLGDSMIAALTEGKAIVEALYHLGYDALAIGNHEPDIGTAVTRQRMRDAAFTVVAANLIERKESKLFAKPYLVKQVCGMQWLAEYDAATTPPVGRIAKADAPKR